MAGAEALLLIVPRGAMPPMALARLRPLQLQTKSPLTVHAEAARVTPVSELLMATVVLSECLDHETLMHNAC